MASLKTMPRYMVVDGQQQRQCHAVQFSSVQSFLFSLVFGLPDDEKLIRHGAMQERVVPVSSIHVLHAVAFE